MHDLKLADRTAIAYTAAAALLLLFAGADVPGRWGRVAVHVAIIVAVLALVRLAPRGGVWAIARAVYPLPLLLFWWGQLEHEIPLLWGSYWTTDWLVRGDQALFGGHPTMLVQSLFTPWLDELMAFCYLSYYLFLAVPVVLVFKRRFDSAVAGYGAILLTYAANFTLFVLFPANSPPQILQQYPDLQPSLFTGFVLGDLIRSLQATDSVTGAAFPSSHIAGSMVCTLVALRFLPRLGRFLVPLLLGMSVATVYLGYHHALDPIFGILLGAAGYAAARRIEPGLARVTASDG